ncbi:MAG: glycosyl hydrolase [bacterium]
MSSSNRMIVGTRKGLFVLERKSAGWKVVRYAHSASPVPYAVVDPRHGTLWASLDHGHWGCKLHRSPDLGATWEEVEAPKYPKSARTKPWTTGKPQPATLRYIWVIQPGGADQPDRLYLGTEPGGLFVSDDGGTTFKLNKGLWDHPSRFEKWFGGGRDMAGIHSVFVDPRDSSRVLVGISCAGVFETLDGGKTWAPRNRGMSADFLPDPEAEVGQDPHYLEACGSDPDVLWQQNHCGIYRSTDGAKSWKLLSKPGDLAHFGFAISADEKNPDAAWVVPAVSDTHRIAVDAKLCVCATTDGGATWKALRKGLPQKDAYDVAFRHALDKSHGTLAFGTTTGNLYFSENRGRSWETIGQNFPPIYSVRFAPAT